MEDGKSRKANRMAKKSLRKAKRQVRKSKIKNALKKFGKQIARHGGDWT